MMENLSAEVSRVSVATRRYANLNRVWHDVNGKTDILMRTI
jgi:hypothetical protein